MNCRVFRTTDARTQPSLTAQGQAPGRSQVQAGRPIAGFSVLSLSVLALAGCGDSDGETPSSASLPPAAASAPAARVATVPEPSIMLTAFEPIRLLPSDTVAVVRCRSLAALEAAALKLSAIAERTGNTFPILEKLDEVLAQAGIDPETIQRGAPIVGAMRLVEGQKDAEFVVYLAVPDEPSMHRRKFNVHSTMGGYVAITSPKLSLPKADPPSWAADMPDGLISIRVDAPTLVDHLAPLVAMTFLRPATAPRGAAKEASGPYSSKSSIGSGAWRATSTRSTPPSSSREGG